MSGIKRNNDGTVKRKHVSLTILQKVELLNKLESGCSVKLLATEFGVGEWTVYNIKKNKEKILSFYTSSDSNVGISEKKTIRATKCEDLDKVLYEWFRQ